MTTEKWCQLGRALSSAGILVGVLALPSPSAGQTLDFSAAANFGEVSLEEGFVPDPRSFEITSGGRIDLSTAIAGESCSGYASSAPDFKLHWEDDDAGYLRIWVEAEGDTTLVINDSDGGWHCDDDSGDGTNPQIELEVADGGRYDIWVGSYSRDENIESTLMISELENDSDFIDSSSDLDRSADANFGDVSLEAGFLPDPRSFEITSGGRIDLSEAVPGGSCRGFATAAPDFKLYWEDDDAGYLRIWVEADDDTTLVINDSNGEWHCDDDSGDGSNPQIELEVAEGGRYDIWVGSYSRDENIESTLKISEYEK